MNKSKFLWTTLGIVLVAGLIWVIASAPKTQAPQSPSEVVPPASVPATSAPGTTTPTPKPVVGTPSGTSKNISLFLVTPQGGEKWVIGTNNTISWTSPAQITGEIMLIQAETNTVVGWINSTTAANQTSYAWDTRYVSTSRNGGIRKEAGPGNYFIQVKFDSASYPVLKSGQITLTTMAQAIEGRTVVIQNYAFNPASTIITHGGKVTFTNNDSVTHDVVFDTSIYPISHIAPGTSAVIDTSSIAPGTYNYYCDIHPSMRGVLTVQ